MGRWSLVVAAGLAIFMAQLDATIVMVVLPTIQRSLGVAPVTAEWVVLGYLVPLIGLSLMGGRWVDIVGRRPGAAGPARRGLVADRSCLAARDRRAGVAVACALGALTILAVAQVAPPRPTEAEPPKGRELRWH